MPRKKSANTKKKKEIEFADGRVADNFSSEAENLENVLGMQQASPFKENSESSFKESLDNMTLTEMQALAVASGVFPSGTRVMLKAKLIKCYKQYSSQGKGSVVQVTKPIVDPESEEGKSLLKLIKDQ